VPLDLAALIVVAGFALVAAGLASLRVIGAHERGVVVRLGRARAGVRGPGLTAVVPFLDRLERVDVRLMAVTIPPVEAVTADGQRMRLEVCAHVRVVDPAAVLSVLGRNTVVSHVCLAAARQVVGESTMDGVIRALERRSAQARQRASAALEQPVGVSVERLDLAVVPLDGPELFDDEVDGGRAAGQFELDLTSLGSDQDTPGDPR
jgi:regulator of protease activity HflC (stomatin/prohibitin superfamily)